MADGLAASLVGVSNTYGNGEGQNTTHYYSREKSKKKGSSMACKTKKPGKK